MPKLKLPIRRFSLSFLGEGWADCYIDFLSLAYSEINLVAGLKISKRPEIEEVQKANKAIMTLLQDKFVEGIAIDAKEKECQLKAKDLESLPIEAFVKAIDFLTRASQTS